MSYEDSGYDAFLSRSIDSLPQTSLDSQGPFTTQIRYDSSYPSGPRGGSVLSRGTNEYLEADGSVAFREGALSGGVGIEFLDKSGHAPLRITKNSSNDITIKAAKTGFDADTATGNDTTFDSSHPTPQSLYQSIFIIPTFITDGTAYYQYFKDTGLASKEHVGVIGFVERQALYSLTPVLELQPGMAPLPFADPANNNELFIQTFLKSGTIWILVIVKDAGSTGVTVGPFTIHYNILDRVIPIS